MPTAASRPPPTVEIVTVDSEQVGQRLDNFLIKHMKGVPKTRLYRALRGGEVRVNGARKKVWYALCHGDRVRLPPLRRASPAAEPRVDASLLEKIPVLFEDAHLLVVDKPAGLAAHGGTGLKYGLIEALRTLRPPAAYLELAHRLDRETSGCLMLAKSRAALLGLQVQFGAPHDLQKGYVALLKGAWQGGAREITIPLAKPKAGNAGNGAARVRQARSIFSPISSVGVGECAFMAIELLTGRMHQARAHAAAIGQPIAGDWRYGDRQFNQLTKQVGLTRLFLHAERLRFRHPINGACTETYAPLPDTLAAVLDNLRAQKLVG